MWNEAEEPFATGHYKIPNITGIQEETEFSQRKSPMGATEHKK